MSKKTIVVGGGICGLFAALILSQRQPGSSIVVLEREPEVGGLLRAFDYRSHGIFDYGMHNMYETGNAELDALQWSLLPQEEWHVLDGAARDLCGLYYQGRLQTHSPFMDMRHLPRDQYAACLAGLFESIGKPADLSNAEAFARSHFGNALAEMAVLPALKKLFGLDPVDLDVLALRLTSMLRVLMFDEQPMLDLMKSDEIRGRVGFPEQRRLPEMYVSGRRGFYPRQYGMVNVIRALGERLRSAGVTIMTGIQDLRLAESGGRVSEAQFVVGGSRRTIEVDHLLWTAGLPGLAGALGIDISCLPFDRPPATIVVNMLLDGPPNMADLYYFYCYDPGHPTFRVTNYAGYCPTAVRPAGHPVCVELLDDGTTSLETLRATAVSELLHFKVIDDPSQVRFAQAERLTAGFPMPSRKNLGSLEKLRDSFRERKLGNIKLAGVLSEPHLFFQSDVLRHLHETIRAGEV